MKKESIQAVIVLVVFLAGMLGAAEPIGWRNLIGGGILLTIYLIIIIAERRQMMKLSAKKH